MRRGVIILSAMAGVLGLAHIGLTALVFESWTLDALWFLGTGLAMVFAAAVNVVVIEPSHAWPKRTVIGINSAMAGYFLAAWQVLPAPQVVIGGVIFLSLSLFALGSMGRSKTGEA